MSFLAHLFSCLGIPVVNFFHQRSVSGTHHFYLGTHSRFQALFLKFVGVTFSGSYVFILIFVVRIELDRKRMTDKKLSMEHISEKINAGTSI
jgi:hypothetical protein